MRRCKTITHLGCRGWLRPIDDHLGCASLIASSEFPSLFACHTKLVVHSTTSSLVQNATPAAGGQHLARAVSGRDVNGKSSRPRPYSVHDVRTHSPPPARTSQCPVYCVCNRGLAAQEYPGRPSNDISRLPPLAVCGHTPVELWKGVLEG